MNPRKILPLVSVLAAVAAALYWAGSKLQTGRRENATSLASTIEKSGDPFFDSAPPMERPDAEAVRRFSAIEAERRHWDETVWAQELVAERAEEVFIRLWDELRNVEDEFSVLESFPFRELIVGQPGPVEQLENGVSRRRAGPPGRAVDAEEWKRWLRHWKEKGFRLEQSEWRHPWFSGETNGPPRSLIAMTLHIANPTEERRIIVKGDLRVEWETPANPTAPPIPRVIDATDFEMSERSGPAPFQQVMAKEIAPPKETIFIDPLILYDLDGDGLSEIILGCSNLLLRNRGGGTFEVGPLCASSTGLINAAVVADFNGDGAADLLCCDRQGLLLQPGDRQGHLAEARRRVWKADVKLLNPFVITCGDVDGDGDLDAWLAQYKLPYFGGQMPTPYYDANDGFPSFLLINDGRGNFRDATESAGLAAKRFRRTYSSSLVDLDEDGDLDLVVVSDFAGADVYYNDGRGRFTEVTSKVLDEPHAFGMAHSFGDYDGDGQLDFLMIGMNSFVAQRLEALGIGPPEFPQHQRMRPTMGYGNRLYFRRGAVFRQEPMSGQVSRTGWSWGCASLDFDNDGDLDIYVANGHRSRQSAKDYETQFWRHDVYAASSRHDPAVDLYFGAVGDRLYGSGYSYGGHESNRLLMNLSGQGFVEVGYLMGLAMEEDCRNVVSDDLDGDGREDLIVTTFEGWPTERQTLRILRNKGDLTHNWIGVGLRDAGPGFSAVGAMVSVTTPIGKQTRVMVSGDSYRSQNSSAVHFGLGKSTNVSVIAVRWPNGRTQTMRDPAINRHHLLAPSKN